MQDPLHEVVSNTSRVTEAFEIPPVVGNPGEGGAPEAGIDGREAVAEFDEDKYREAVEFWEAFEAGGGTEAGGDPDDEAFIPDAWYGTRGDDSDTEVPIGPDNRRRITPTKKYPWRAIASLRMRMPTGQNFIGTGWFISPRTLITAGHCVYMHDSGGWPEYIDVMPGRDGSDTSVGGTIRATKFYSVKGWTRPNPRNNKDYDYGAIILPPGESRKLGTFGYGVFSDSSIEGKWVNVSGYPGDKPPGTQHWHALKAKSVSKSRVTYDIDTAGGQSGAPVWRIVDGSRYAVAIHTNGHYRGNSGTRIIRDVFDNMKKWAQLGAV